MNGQIKTYIGGKIAPIQRVRPNDRFVIAGSIRRGCQKVGDCDVCVSTDDPGFYNANLNRDGMPGFRFYRNQADMPPEKEELPILIELAPVRSESFGAGLVFSTGSRLFNRRVFAHIQAAGLHWDIASAASAGMPPIWPKWSIYPGLYDQSGNPIECPTEESFFETIGLPYIPPERRDEIAKDGWWWVQRGSTPYAPWGSPVELLNRVCLVGNGSSALEIEAGEFIDSCDVVVRFNHAVRKGYERFVGAKVTHWSCIGTAAPKHWARVRPPNAHVLLPFHFKWRDEQRVYEYALRAKRIPHTVVSSDIVSQCTSELVRLNYRTKTPSSGIKVIAHFLRFVPFVLVHGFDAFVSGRPHHYWHDWKGNERQDHDNVAELAWLYGKIRLGRVIPVRYAMEKNLFGTLSQTTDQVTI